MWDYVRSGCWCVGVCDLFDLDSDVMILRRVWGFEV